MKQVTILTLLLLWMTACNLTALPTPTHSLTETAAPPTATTELTPTIASVVTVTSEVPLITILPLTDALTPLSTNGVTQSTGADIPFPTTYINSYGITAREGQRIYINYDVTVTNPGRGRVFILVLDPTRREAGRLVVTDTRADTLEIEAMVAGDYLFYITPENLSGNYTSSYGTR
jgi:hypothetical protein